MAFFKATFFDAIANESFQVQVHATHRFVGIDISNQANQLIKTIYWEHEQIKLDQFHSQEKHIRLYSGASFIEVPSDFLLEVKSKFRFAPYLSSTNNLLVKQKWLIAGGIIIATMALIVMLIIPLLGNLIVNLFPIKTEIKIGEALKKQVFAQEHLVIDSTKTIAVNAFFKHVKIESDYPIKITVVQSDQLNAFALPGGNIVVYSALLQKIKKYEALVALLGHESGHITHRHSLKAMLKNASTYLIIAIIAGDYNGASAALLAQLSELHNLSYSRENESDADHFSFEIMRKNKLNPEGMISLFQILKTQDQGENIPGILLTHPKLDDRINWAKKEIANNDYDIEINKNLERSFAAIGH
jgi:Zn-dependent protease with chaperone function